MHESDDTATPPAADSPATMPETIARRDETAAEIERLKAELAEKTEKLRQTENELRQAGLAASRASERAVDQPFVGADTWRRRSGHSRLP